jgi:hypothetical protein
MVSWSPSAETMPPREPFEVGVLLERAHELAACMPAIRPSALLKSSNSAGGSCAAVLADLLGHGDGVADHFAAGAGEGSIGHAGVARILLAFDQADFFQRQQAAGDAGGGQGQPLGQVDAAQAAARRAVQVMQQHEVVEADAVVAAQHLVQAAHQRRLRARQAQREFQAGADGCLVRDLPLLIGA